MKQVWVVVLLLLPTAFATSIITSETNITLEDGIATIQNNMEVNSEEEIRNLTLILAPNANDAEILVDDEEKECLSQAEFIRCGNVSKGKHTIKISYETDYLTAEVGENTLIRYTDRLPYHAKNQKITLKLPVGYIIPQERGKDESFYISPKPKEVYSDGQRIILYWEQEGQELPISAVARKVIGPPLGWIASTLIAAIAAAGVATWVVLNQRRKPKPVQKKTIIPALIDNEQKIVNFLKETGEVWQKQIHHETGFSKAKVSRILRNLEERGVITKTIYGNTNKIALKK